MKMSLSVRVAEAFHNKEESAKTIDELIALARSCGYDALCMRASQAGVHSPADRVNEIAAKIRSAGLAVSMITGDFEVPGNNEQGPMCLRGITPHLDLAERFGADLIRVCMKKEDDIVWAQRASDEARERGIRLAHQSHCASLFETVDGTEPESPAPCRAHAEVAAAACAGSAYRACPAAVQSGSGRVHVLPWL